MKFFGKKSKGNSSDNPESQDTEPEKKAGKFAPRRIVIGMFLTIAILWVMVTFIGFFVPSQPESLKNNQLAGDKTDRESSSSSAQNRPPRSTNESSANNSAASSAISEKSDGSTGQTGRSQFETPETLPVPKTKKEGDQQDKAEREPRPKPAPFGERPSGIAVTEAIIEPLAYELKGRFWGWRVNDLIQITDNVQNYQLGVLEVSRRAIVALAERMSRTGSTALYDPNLEMAMNWIMVKADAYWFPSAESKYKEAISDLKTYRDRLENGTADFYTRTDNLIPLLSSFEDLLGSCDENLLKMKESDGSKVSFFKADDYFYYTKGVVESMRTILEAVREDYYKTLDSRRSVEIIDHALHSLEHGEHVHPWIVLNSGLSSIFANHRSNLAGPVSHARFHIGLLIKALST